MSWFRFLLARLMTTPPASPASTRRGDDWSAYPCEYDEVRKNEVTGARARAEGFDRRLIGVGR